MWYYGGKQKCIQDFDVKTLRKESILEDLVGDQSGFGGLEVACWPLVPKFAGSKPGRSRRIFRAKKSSARLPSEGK
jgi:hypothetical protein